MFDYDDEPDVGPDGAWFPVNPTIVHLTVNGAKRNQWGLC